VNNLLAGSVQKDTLWFNAESGNKAETMALPRNRFESSQHSSELMDRAAAIPHDI
jgi:hypothetical protein